MYGAEDNERRLSASRRDAADYGQDAASPAPLIGANVAEAVRLAGEFFIRGVEICARAHAGDLLRGIIFTAIAVANGEASAGGRRRPVSVMAISHSIGVPYETTRRYVNLLVADGLCRREGRAGILVLDEAFERPELLVAYRETFASFNRLAAALRRVSAAPA
ncbi:MAG: hypothetical protein ACOY4K_07300 [Pseudomonadota bacterium]